jgi:4-oxalocrotonate tautomerase
MPLLRVEMWPGRSQESKEKLIRALTDVMVQQVGCPEQAVTIIYQETPKESWAIGGRFCSEIYKDRE